MAKKSYNPFKMWGAWLGIIMGIILGFVAEILELIGECTGEFGVGCNAIDAFDILTILTLGMFWIFVIVGFLVGWAIHSLIRRLR